MKKQWAEEHQPRVDCSLEKMGGEVYLAIINISNNVATNVEIKITTNVTETQLLKRTIDLFEKTKFVIPPTYKKSELSTLILYNCISQRYVLFGW